MKGVVPSPVLKSSLDDMALDTFNPQNQFADSDDEDNDENNSKTTSKKKNLSGSSNEDEYSGSLSIKTGRNTNTTLYYCDYSKLSNNGNGLLPDDRNILLSDHEAAKAELEAKDTSTKSMTAETVKLLSEPTNAEATVSLEEAEENVKSLREQVDAAQELRGFEKHRIKIRKRVDVMAGQWRKRRRVCMDFLINMEENTDGSVSMKKCLSGDGQIYIGEFALICFSLYITLLIISNSSKFKINQSSSPNQNATNTYRIRYCSLERAKRVCQKPKKERSSWKTVWCSKETESE